MTRSEVDLFHDGLLDDAARGAFLARAATDEGLREDLAFRVSLDERLRTAFGAPPDFAAMADAATESQGPRRRFPFFAAAAVLLLGAAVLFALFHDGRERVDAARLWGEMEPVFGCSEPVRSCAVFEEHCRAKYGVALQIDPGKGVHVHGPTKSAAIPTASVLTVSFPSGSPGTPPDTRVVLIGRELPVRANAMVRVFRREVEGLQIVELTTADAPRALPMFR